MKVLTTDEFITRAIKVHGGKYDYSHTVYHNSRVKISYQCSLHGEITQLPLMHLRGRGCKRCGCMGDPTDDHSYQWFIKSMHGKNDYDYKKWYGPNPVHINILCNKHGWFSQNLQNHRRGSICPSCVGNQRHTNETFISAARLLHGSMYDYSNVQYTKSRNKVTIICPIHGPFEQIAADHINQGNGCSKCGYVRNGKGMRLSNDEFIGRANKCHNNKYDYSKTAYHVGHEKVTIICPTHGPFEQIAADHLSGKGCAKCGHNVSKPANDWLSHISIPDDSIHREVRGLVGQYVVDGYNPETKTVYEFHGDFWHGNPEVYESDVINPVVGLTFGELYERTAIRRQLFIASGFKCVEMWESEWKRMKP